MNNQNEIVVKEPSPADLMRRATDVAGVSKEIVLKTACNIKGKKYVKIEGWQAIAVAHGCILSARDVEKLESGFRAIGEVRRIDNGAVIATAEGFVGNDESTWGSRDEYAKRAMAQTRAMSRAGRSAFAHVVVMIDEKLSTTPYEEIPEDSSNEHTPKGKPSSFEKLGSDEIVISEGQRKRLFAITKEAGAKPQQLKEWLLTRGIDSTEKILRRDYDTICGMVAQGVLASPPPAPDKDDIPYEWDSKKEEAA